MATLIREARALVLARRRWERSSHIGIACLVVFLSACGNGSQPARDAGGEAVGADGHVSDDAPGEVSVDADAHVQPDDVNTADALSEVGIQPEGGGGVDAGDDAKDAPADMDIERDAPAEAVDTRDAPADMGVQEDADSGGDVPQETSFNCIEGWPSAPSPPPVPAAPLAVQPRILWTTALPPAGANSPAMVATGTGVGVVWGSGVTFVDGEGNITGRYDGPPEGELLSFAAAGTDGSLYLADSTSAFRLDPDSQVVWRTKLDPSRTQGEFRFPPPPLLDHLGRLYVAGLDGNLWTFESQTGSVIWKQRIGLAPGNAQARSLQMGVAGALIADARGVFAPGTTYPIGAFSPSNGTWSGALSDGVGWYPSYAIAGWDIGIVATGSLDSSLETKETIILDRCGKLRWRVPGQYGNPIAITFNDDLIVRDLVRSGNTYISSMRRFSRDGSLLAGPVSVEWPIHAYVGADDTLYLVTCDQLGGTKSSLIALGPSLQQVWKLQLPDGGCSTNGVLNQDGRLFTFTIVGGQEAVLAIQTTSPGVAPVSWPIYGHRDARSTGWLSSQ